MLWWNKPGHAHVVLHGPATRLLVHLAILRMHVIIRLHQCSCKTDNFSSLMV